MKMLGADSPSAPAMRNAMVLRSAVSFFQDLVGLVWMQPFVQVAEAARAAAVDWVDVNPLPIVPSVKSAAPFLVS